MPTKTTLIITCYHWSSDRRFESACNWELSLWVTGTVDVPRYRTSINWTILWSFDGVSHIILKSRVVQSSLFQSQINIQQTKNCHTPFHFIKRLKGSYPCRSQHRIDKNMRRIAHRPLTTLIVGQPRGICTDLPTEFLCFNDPLY